mmetsp:Transcript_15957/g.50107  ORF Transcript_15957/g.50107 Transcript_15957/m.50107 type:complete len:240 (-) Transcript_15957:1009-1728(-)
MWPRRAPPAREREARPNELVARGGGELGLVDLRDIAACSLQLVHQVVGLGIAHVALRPEDLEQRGVDVLLRLLRAAEEEVPLGARRAEVLPDELRLLRDLVLDVDLLGGVPGPRVAALHKALRLVALELVAVIVLRLGVPAPEEQHHGPNLVAVVLLELPLLHEGAEGREASAEARHEDHGRLVGRELHDGVRGVPDAVVAGADERQEARAQPELRVAALCLPVLPHDQELALARVEVA